MKNPSWYDRGYIEGCEGICDAPYERGNKHFESYMAGNADGAVFLENVRYKGDYYGAPPSDDHEQV